MSKQLDQLLTYKQIKVTSELFKKIVSYLEERPYKEVHEIFELIERPAFIPVNETLLDNYIEALSTPKIKTTKSKVLEE